MMREGPGSINSLRKAGGWQPERITQVFAERNRKHGNQGSISHSFLRCHDYDRSHD